MLEVSWDQLLLSLYMVVCSRLNGLTLSLSLSLQSIVIGPGGSTIQAITVEAIEDLEALLKCPVELTLNVRTSKK